MAIFKTTSDDYTINVGPTGNNVLTINAATTVFNGNTIFVVPAVTSAPFLTVAANNTGAITKMGLLAQTGNASFAGLRFNSVANAWQTSNNVFANGEPVTSYANIGEQAAGANSTVQFNLAGQLAGDSDFVYDPTANLLTVGNISATGNIFGNITANFSANIIYVASNGNDSTGDGSLARPYATIDKGLIVANTTPKPVSVHVAPGNYTINNPVTIPANTSLMGDNIRNVFIEPANPSLDMFWVRGGCYVWGVTIRNYLANGFAYPPTGPQLNVFVSPYIQNLTSSTTTGTAVFIDGNRCTENSTKAMIVGFFTIINRGGRGIDIRNRGYSQLVNIYTIACDVGIYVETGSFCTLNGSDCSIGNFGLVANGVGALQTTGTTVGNSQAGIFQLKNLTASSGNTSLPRPRVNTVMKINAPGYPDYYTIATIIPDTGNVSNATVVIQETFTDVLPGDTTVDFFWRSSIIASAHTFEYVGAGTNPATALPQNGGIPIEANEVRALNGGIVTFTSTDDKGNFKVGSQFIVNQATATITGDAFYKSLFAQMTPYILALGSNN
jgi:hypothetical protein